MTEIVGGWHWSDPRSHYSACGGVLPEASRHKFSCFGPSSSYAITSLDGIVFKVGPGPDLGPYNVFGVFGADP